MEHAEALERIEIAAAEPEGLERLMAGDTPDAAAVAGHLAGCQACVAELARIRRTSEIAREVIRAEPDPALRERTLAFVRAVGRDRSPGTADAAGTPGGAAVASPVSVATRAPVAARRPWLVWTAGLAAALVVAASLGFAAGGASRNGDVEGRESEIAVLEDVAGTAMRVAAQPDARQVALVAPSGAGSAGGSLVFSPADGELVVVAMDLVPEAAGTEYGCWVEVDGTRRRLGRMYWAGEVWAWAGPASGLADLPSGTVFGVSLGPIGGGGSTEPVLTGRL